MNRFVVVLFLFLQASPSEAVSAGAWYVSGPMTVKINATYLSVPKPARFLSGGLVIECQPAVRTLRVWVRDLMLVDHGQVQYATDKTSGSFSARSPGPRGTQQLLKALVKDNIVTFTVKGLDSAKDVIAIYPLKGVVKAIKSLHLSCARNHALTD